MSSPLGILGEKVADSYLKIGKFCLPENYRLLAARDFFARKVRDSVFWRQDEIRNGKFFVVRISTASDNRNCGDSSLLWDPLQKGSGQLRPEQLKMCALFLLHN